MTEPPRWTRDPLRGRWVIQAPARGGRPDRTLPRDDQPRDHRARDHGGQACPFCPGNEAATPPETGRVEGDGGWLARAFPNLYPAVASGEGRPPATGAPARGDHEVLVTTPDHDDSLADFADRQAAAALELVRSRTAARLAAGRRYVLTFVNHGGAAGASVDHPHGQLVALDHIPRRVRDEQDAITGAGCALCVLSSRGDLTVARGDGHVLVTPPWAASPGQLLLFDGNHRPEPGDDAALGALLRDGLRAVRTVHGDVAYNLVMHPAPPGGAGHGHLHIHPRTTRPGGFELGSGIAVDPTRPTADAAALRDALDGQQP